MKLKVSNKIQAKEALNETSDKIIEIYNKFNIKGWDNNPIIQDFLVELKQLHNKHFGTDKVIPYINDSVELDLLN